MEGTKLGKYEIRATLGRGAMGTVYEAWDPAIERKVAIKTVRLPAGDDEEAKELLERFRREVQAAGRLNHPNVVNVFDYGEAGASEYIVMEFVEGRSLLSIIDSGQRISLPDLLRIMEDLLTGLQFSHQHGVIHRDIKPANIMLTLEGRAKIADFGVARIGNSGITQDGAIIGTPAYMSPEQFMGQTVDPRSDIYSAGVVLYQLLTRERPFEGNPTSIMHKVLNTRPPKPSDLSVLTPPALDAVVERAMARRPEDRYPDAAAFATALRQAMPADSGSPAGVVGDLPMEDDATVIAPRRGAMVAPALPTRSGFSPVLVGVALFAIIVVGAGVWLVLGQHKPATMLAQRPESSPPQTAAQLPAGALPPADRPSVPGLQPDLNASVTQAFQQPQPSAPIRGADVPAVSPPAGNERAAAPTQLAVALTPPAELRRAAQATIAPIPCALVSGDVIGDGNALELRAIVAANSEALLRAAVAKAVPMLAIDWHIETFTEPYCKMLELIRPMAAKFGMLKGGLTLTTDDGRTKLFEGDRIVLRINAPNYPSHVRLDDLQGDGSVYHMQPSDGYPGRLYEPLSQQTWGDARPGVVEPPVVQAPFGIDLIIAIASRRPLFVERRPPKEKLEVYLRGLRTAIAAAQARNDSITATALLLTTGKRQ